MPTRDPGIWLSMWESMPDPVRAAIVGTLVALLRVMYDDKEPSLVRRLLECTLCGAIALCVASGAQALGLQGDYSTFAGGAIGLIGADTVRAWARRLAEQRVKDLEGKP